MVKFEKSIGKTNFKSLFFYVLFFVTIIIKTRYK